MRSTSHATSFRTGCLFREPGADGVVTSYRMPFVAVAHYGPGGKRPKKNDAWRAVLLFASQSFGAGELPELVVALAGLPVRANRFPRLGQRFRIGHRDAVFEQAWTDETDTLPDHHLVAVGREA